MKRIVEPPKDSWEALLQRPSFDRTELEGWVDPILQSVQVNGDWALKEFTKKYDEVDLTEIEIPKKTWTYIGSQLDEALKDAIRQAYANIKKFHESQIREEEVVETMPGVKCWRRSKPIQRVGFYIPGGTAPLFSTVLMLGVPAQLAGCPLKILCTPPSKTGRIHSAILFAAELVGVDRVFQVGGAQAIAAMAYGTETVPKVDKILGPGNQYVTIAKQLVSRTGTAIDMPAGPSEVAVVADDTAVPEFVASDLLAQAEHGKDSQVVCVCQNEDIAEAIHMETYRQLEALPRKEITSEALKNSRMIVLKDRKSMIDLINVYAPEHLILSVDDPHEMAEHIVNAGSIFLGNFTPESAGDYASGTNHTLPTNGYATTYSGVSVDTYVKKITYQEISQKGIQNLGPVVEKMAEAEELMAHKLSVSVRLSAIKKESSK